MEPMDDAKREQGWEDHERQQRRAWLALTYAQRLQWLEEAKEFAAAALGAALRDGRSGTK